MVHGWAKKIRLVGSLSVEAWTGLEPPTSWVRLLLVLFAMVVFGLFKPNDVRPFRLELLSLVAPVVLRPAGSLLMDVQRGRLRPWCVPRLTARARSSERQFYGE